jgi:hypothetical protein
MGYRSGQNSRFDNPQNPTAASLSVKHRFDPPVCNQLNTIDMSIVFRNLLEGINNYHSDLKRSNNHEIAQAISKERARLRSSWEKYKYLAFSKSDENILHGFAADFEKGKRTSNHQLAIGAVKELADFYEKKVNGSI